MKRILTVVCCLFLCSISAMAQKMAAKEKAMRDQRFVDFVAQIDMVEANLGQLAKAEGVSQSVKDCAQLAITDQTNDFRELSGLARQAGLRVPSAIDTQNNRTLIVPLQRLKGETFDRQYIQKMIAEDARAIAIYKKEAVDAETPALKSYANKTLPVLEKHLASAKDIEKTKAS